MGVSTQSTWGVKKANHGSCHSDSKKRSWRYLQIPHPSTQGKRQASQPRLRREEWFHQGSHQGDRPRLRPWRPTRQGPLPQHPQVQDGQGAHDRLRGHVHWHVRLQRSQSCSPHGKHHPTQARPRRLCHLQPRGQDWRPWQPSELLLAVVALTSHCSRLAVPSTSTASRETLGQRLVVLPLTLWSTLTVVEITSTLDTLPPAHAPLCLDRRLYDCCPPHRSSCRLQEGGRQGRVDLIFICFQTAPPKKDFVCQKKKKKKKKKS